MRVGVLMFSGPTRKDGWYIVVQVKELLRRSVNDGFSKYPVLGKNH
jgi:hypothetical protein